ncbi:hypothetical protein [Fusobacterium varium]|uniref:hypothetical protein n=1 Tax=Fusobacterium varium TaxID=856 RepID=UPI00266D13DE|nr:hypothetical protein [Fusobacterium varium]
MGKFTIEKKIQRKKRELKKLMSNKSKEKRKIRKEKLIKLGTLFFILDLLDEPQENILGYLSEYKNLPENIKYAFSEIGENILKNKDQKSYNDIDIQDRKYLFYRMIRKSALLEKLKLHLEDPNIIIGYLSHYKKVSEEDKKIFFEKGVKIFSDGRKNDIIISDEEKLNILRKSFVLKIDLTKFLKENYNLNIHEIKKSQYEKILENLKK